MARNLRTSVGRMGGVNQPTDVTTVQELLNNVPTASGGPSPPLKVDGLCGPITTAAIQNFQLKHFGWPGTDGKVDTDGQTLKKLNDFEQAAPATPSRPVSTNFQMRVVELGVRSRDPLLKDGLDNPQRYQIVDRDNRLAAVYVDKATVFPAFSSDRNRKPITRGAPFTFFNTPEPFSAGSFSGPCTLIRRSSGSKSVERFMLTEVEGKQVSLDIVLAGFPQPDAGQGSAVARPSGTELVLLEQGVTPFAG